MIAASGLSTQSTPVRAVLEALRQTTPTVPSPDLVLVFASGAPAAEPDLIAATNRELTESACVVGCSGIGVLTEAGEVEGDGVAVLAISGISVRAAQRTGLRDPQTLSLALADLELEDRGAVIALFDAMTLSPELTTAAIQRQLPLSVPIFGGGVIDLGGKPWVLSGTHADAPVADAVAAAWLPEVHCHWGLSHACLPLTPALPITEAEGGVIVTLGGRRAIDVLREAVRAPMMSNFAAMARSIFVGISDPGTPHLIRPLIGIDPHGGALAIGGPPAREGQTLTVLMRDAGRAREDLQAMLSTLPDGPGPTFGLFIKGAGRGKELYGELAGIETALVSAAFPEMPFAGFLSACELVPAEPGAALHLYGALLGVFS